MKKLISASVAAILTISLSACRANNVGMENRNNGSANIGRASGTGNNGVNNFKDGAYIGFGNSHTNGNERAIVVVRNGSIADIYLSSIDQQDTTPGNTAANANNTQVDTGTGSDLEGGSRNQPGAGVIPGTRPGAAIGNTAGHDLGDIRSNLVNTMIQNQSADVNINVSNTDNNMRSIIDNWKLAVSRALDQARR